MDHSEHASPAHEPPTCAAVRHLQWTLSIDWRTELPEPKPQDAPLQPGWRSRATSWRDGQHQSEQWAKSIDPSQTPSWAALQQAHIAAGLNPRFRTGPATSNGHYYDWYQDLERRMIRKFDVDGTNNVTPLTRAIRGFLDIIHTQPFTEGNTRAGCNWVVWSLAGVGIDVPDLGPLVELPKPPANDSITSQMAALLSA